jgi:hypothetical protein
MVKMLRSGTPSEKRGKALQRYADAFEKGSKEFKIDLDLILSVAFRESSFTNDQHPQNKGTGVMQILPHDKHIREYIDKEYGKPHKMTYKKWVQKNILKAIRIGIYELSFFRAEWKRYIRHKCRRKMPETMEISLSPWKRISESERVRKRFFFLPHYNWGPRCLYKTRARSYPYLVMKHYRKIQRLRKKLSLY